MGKKLLNTDVVTQIGIIVRDIEATSQEWAKFLGIENPGWIVTAGLEEAQTNYRGSPSEARAKLAFFELGNLTIELIEPDQQPSTWREFLDQHGEGVHHIAFGIKGMAEQKLVLKKAGFEFVQSGEYTGGRYAYFDSLPQLKVLLELLEND